MSMERLLADKKPIWESATRNKANDSSLVQIAKHNVNAKDLSVL